MACRYLALTLLLSTALVCMQQPAATSRPGMLLEFPVVLQQKIIAGDTPVGTPVKAKLVIATLVNGVVIPEDAVFTGEVTESVAKSPKTPSRLGIRIDSAQWKKGSTPLAAYLTAWYYPIKTALERRNASGQPNFGGEVGVTLGGRGSTDPTLSDPMRRRRFPGDDDPMVYPDLSDTPKAQLSEHRLQLKDVESVHAADGAIVLTCARRNLKLDKATTYVLAVDELPNHQTH